ncbi:GNAT family N-acetyltransferase [Kitasatospora cinereorecta]
MGAESTLRNNPIMETPTLKTARLVLAAPHPSDIDEITAACQDPEIQRWTVVPSPYSRSDAEFFVDRLAPEGWRSGTNATFVVRTAEGALVGTQGVALKSGRPGTGEIGFWNAAGQRGHGYATEASRAVIAWAFAELGLRRLEWVAYVGNEPSRALADRLGFTFEGTLRSYDQQRGTYRDCWVGSLLATDPR